MRPSIQERLALATVNSKCSVYLPEKHEGKESTLPMAVLTQELLLYAERCMRHEDVSKKNHAGILKPHLRRVVMRLFCGTNRGNGTVQVG